MCNNLLSNYIQTYKEYFAQARKRFLKKWIQKPIYDLAMCFSFGKENFAKKNGGEGLSYKWLKESYELRKLV